MIELIWSLLNIVIFIYFVIICFKATKIIRDKLGVFAALLFVFGLLSFIVRPNDEKFISKTFDLNEHGKLEGDNYSRELKLEDNLTTEIRLYIAFREDERVKKLISAQTHRSGFVSGTNWNVEMINVEKLKEENNYFYHVRGVLEWNILGMKIYSEPKNFKGKAKLTK